MSSKVDKEGFLVNRNDWNESVAQQLAAQHDIQLTDPHWEIIELLRRFYASYDHAPAMRALVKYTAQELGKDKGRSIYLLTLFPGSPAKLGAKIAGLPKPDNCL
ncbi:MAG: TusE/DsrC/DsvC family sulfur relay protein [Pseudomonadales bacterium]